MQKVIKFFAKINIHFLYKCIFYCIFASRKEIDAKLQHYFINVQEKLLINIMPSRNLEMIDLELYRMTSPSTKFKHTNVITATINGINFRLEEKDEEEE